MRKLIIGCCLLLLAGCSATLGTFTNPVSQAQVYNLENAYGVVQTAAVTYARLRRCAVSPRPPCARQAVIIQLSRADTQARAALDSAENFVRSNPQGSAVSYISAARTAVAAFQQIALANGVR